MGMVTGMGMAMVGVPSTHMMAMQPQPMSQIHPGIVTGVTERIAVETGTGTVTGTGGTETGIAGIETGIGTATGTEIETETGIVIGIATAGGMMIATAALAGTEITGTTGTTTGTEISE